MKLLDILIVLLLLWGGYRGYKSGFVMEVFSLFSFSIAKIISIKVLQLVKILYGKWHGHDGTIPAYIGFGVCFITIVAIIYLLGRVFKSKLHKTTLRKVDKWAGSAVGMGTWAFYISSAIWFANLLNIQLPDSYIANTILFPVIKVFSPTFMSLVSKWLPTFKRLLDMLKSV
jgi:membrane protein required for colicin V production